MVRIIAQHDLRNKNAKMIEAVLAGETFVITRDARRQWADACAAASAAAARIPIAASSSDTAVSA